MKVIIIAGGDQSRWNNYLGIPKHYVELDGEPLLERTVRQFRQKGLKKSEVIVTSRYYELEDATNFRPIIDKGKNGDANKFIDSQELWDKQERTIIVYGDVYFTDEAIDHILDYEGKDFRLFCRPWKSIYTGTPWGECFAFSLYPKDHRRAKEQLRRIADLHLAKKINRCGGWEWVRAMFGVPDDKVRKPHLTECPLYYVIDDLTDDIDYPDDYERLKKVLATI